MWYVARRRWRLSNTYKYSIHWWWWWRRRRRLLCLFSPYLRVSYNIQYEKKGKNRITKIGFAVFFFCFWVFHAAFRRSILQEMTVICKLIVWCVFGVRNNGTTKKGAQVGRDPFKWIGVAEMEKAVKKNEWLNFSPRSQFVSMNRHYIQICAANSCVMCLRAAYSFAWTNTEKKRESMSEEVISPVSMVSFWWSAFAKINWSFYGWHLPFAENPHNNRFRIIHFRKKCIFSPALVLLWEISTESTSPWRSAWCALGLF